MTKVVFVVLALLFVAVVSDAKTKTKGSFVPFCPNIRATKFLVTGRFTFPARRIKAALNNVVNRGVLKLLKYRTSSRSVARPVLIKGFRRFNTCPAYTERLRKVSNCWVVWPRIPVVRCSHRPCKFSLPWFGHVRGRCLGSSFVTHRYVLLACRRYFTYVFRWVSVRVPVKCSCLPCY